MCIPGSPRILASLRSNHEIFLMLLVSVWELGEASGPLFIGPLSETYGRLPVYHMTNILFIIFSIACAVSSNIDMLLAFRFLNGVGVAAICLNSSVVGDMFIQEERAGIQAIINLPALTGLAIASIVSGYISENLGWRWVFWLLCYQYLWGFLIPQIMVKHSENILLSTSIRFPSVWKRTAIWLCGRGVQ
ncbi:hypothetical protein OCU04_011083 [Sclerotinia nivalis]|uniref:Major facilitator superfamily (MFS) profile domain-containing protein n=1 Tax=Sclerotinia nivalis TaxID=352851 RepID=A0A9X0DFP0_9HELO|nr:hypothetical protein OCU04_011083 [Sclerotinia nivalis]